MGANEERKSGLWPFPRFIEEEWPGGNKRKTAAYAAAATGALPVLRINGRIYVSRPAYERMLAEAGRPQAA